ncbi:magnesium/cobalt transporter CorA [Chloroflexota bacterium]
MPRLIRKVSKKAGMPPGTLVYIGDKKDEKTRITVFDYDIAKYEENEVASAEECFPFKEKPSVTWINVDGLQQLDVIEKLGKHFGLHPLLLEDVLNTEQRPKMEDFGDYIFIVLKMLFYDSNNDSIHAEHISLVLGSNFVISFQEHTGDVFDPIRERIRKDKGRIRKTGADYLTYALIDTIVDNYFIIIEKIGDRIEDTETELAANPTSEILQTIRKTKKELLFLRKSVWPLREVVSRLEKAESPLILDSSVVYLRDVYDHTIQVIDTVESFRDTVSGMLDVYLSSISNKMNEVMKVLTIFAAIFIPLTFVAGIYGMNFDFMPELRWRMGYFGVIIIMASIGGGMLFRFKKKGWL